MNDPFDSYFGTAADSATYLGHHREYTRGELRLALERTGFRVKECRATEEDLSGLLYSFRRQAMPTVEILRHRRAIAVRALGKFWQGLHLPFGRVLWAVGEKPT
ncbi:MAG: hypothetical protein ACRD5K_16230 [Candidatus Acidiferrales bacterium]